ncbi:hypothetical protein D3C76_90060 [compost metagenome]
MQKTRPKRTAQLRASVCFMLYMLCFVAKLPVSLMKHRQSNTLFSQSTTLFAESNTLFFGLELPVQSQKVWLAPAMQGRARLYPG